MFTNDKDVYIGSSCGLLWVQLPIPIPVANNVIALPIVNGSCSAALHPIRPQGGGKQLGDNLSGNKHFRPSWIDIPDVLRFAKRHISPATLKLSIFFTFHSSLIACHFQKASTFMYSIYKCQGYGFEDTHLHPNVVYLTYGFFTISPTDLHE